jgi:hypothetical protein
MRGRIHSGRMSCFFPETNRHSRGEGGSVGERGVPPRPLAASAAAGPEALDLASLRRRNVVSPAAHLAHQTLLLHLAPELSQCLLEFLRILYDDLQRVITPLSKSLSRSGQP